MDSKLHENFAALKKDPALFAEKILNIRLMPWQRVVAKDFLKSGNDYLAIRSSIGTGKTTLIAVLAHHGLFCNNDIVIQICGPSYNQTKRGVFKEVKRLYDEAPKAYQQLFSMTASQMTRKDNESSYAFIQTAPIGKSENVQGVHAQICYNFVDESSGVNDEIYQSIRNGMSTSNSKMLCVSNPKHLTGWFYNIFNGPEGRIFKKYRISAADSEMVSDEYVQSIADTFGTDHAEYRIKVLGEFAELDGESLAIVPEYLNAAFDRGLDENKVDEKNLPIWGIDVAGAGADKSMLVSRTDDEILSMDQIKPTDLTEQCGEIVVMYEQAAQKPTQIFIDSIGIGQGLADRLREVFEEKGYGTDKVVAVKSSHRPSDSNKFLNLKAEMIYKLCSWVNGKMREGGEIIINGDKNLKELLREELFMLKQDLSSSGKILYKPRKDDYRRELGRSPDVLDALSLTFSGKVYSNEKKWQKIDYSVLDKRMRI